MAEKFIEGPSFKKYSLLASFLFLIKDINSEEKAYELLMEIKRILQEKVDIDSFMKDYNNINAKLLEQIKDKDFEIFIDKENITNSTLYIKDFDKKYYLFDKLIRVNFSKNAKLFEYSDFIILYIEKRIYYLYENNIIDKLVEEIKNDVDYDKCEEIKKYINNNEDNKIYRYFFNNLFNNINKDFDTPIELISKILQTNIILLNKDRKVRKVIKNNENYKYILLTKSNKKYIPLYTKDKKIFYNEDNIIDQILGIKEDNRLDKIIEKMSNKEDTNDIKDYVSNLDLDEA